MANMSFFFRTFLSDLATFLGSDPVIYLFGLICFSAVLRMVWMLINPFDKY